MEAIGTLRSHAEGLNRVEKRLRPRRRAAADGERAYEDTSSRPCLVVMVLAAVHAHASLAVIFAHRPRLAPRIASGQSVWHQCRFGEEVTAAAWAETDDCGGAC